MEKELISLVIPVYNVEKYLDRCLNSLVRQTYRNLEIILVDDGSPDGCPQKCDDWARKDSRIKVIHKKNAGLGMARNTGIENATGTYICFFDSDDYIALNTIEKAYMAVTQDSADIAVFGFCSVGKNGTMGVPVVPQTDKKVYTDEEIHDEFLPNLIARDMNMGKNSNLWMSACAAMYSMQLINAAKWRFVSEREIISEDVYSLLRLYKSVRCVTVIPEAFYFYCENDSSLTHTYRRDRYEKIKHFYNSCQKLCDELNYGQAIRDRLAYPYIANVIAALKMIALSDSPPKEQKLQMKEIIKDEHLQTIVHKIDLRWEPYTRKALLQAIKAKSSTITYILVEANIWLKRKERQ